MDIGTAKLTPAPSGVGCRTICWTSGTCGDRQRGRVPASGAGGHRGHRPPGPPARAGRRVRPLRAGRAGRPEFPGTDPVVRERLEAELAALGPAALHDRLAALTRPRPRPSCPPTAAGSCAPWRSSRCWPSVHRRAARITGRGTRRRSSGCGSPARNWTGGSRNGPADVARTDSWTRWPGWRDPACGRARPRAVPSGTHRCCGSWRGSAPWMTPWPDHPGDEAFRAPPGVLVPP